MIDIELVSKGDVYQIVNKDTGNPVSGTILERKKGDYVKTSFPLAISAVEKKILDRQ